MRPPSTTPITPMNKISYTSARVQAGPGDRDEWVVAQAQAAQKHEQAESGQIGQPIPVDGQRPELQGDRINLRMNQHGRHCAATPGPPDCEPTSPRCP